MKKFLTFFALLCALLGFSVPISAAITLMGGSNADWETGITMTQVGTSTDYVCEVTNPGNYQYQIKDGDNWYGYGESDASWAPSSFPAYQALTQGKKNFAINSNGKFYVTFNTTTKQVTISPVLYLRGAAYSNWATLESNKFSCVGNVYSLYMSNGISVGSGSDTGWKIDDGNNNYNFGKGTEDASLGQTVKAWFKSPATFNTATSTSTQILFTLVPGSAVQGSSTPSQVELVSVPTPYIYNGTTIEPFSLVGDRWETSFTAQDAAYSFRIQNTPAYTAALGKEDNTVKGAILYTSDPIADATSLNLYVYGESGGYFTLSSGYKYTLSFARNADFFTQNQAVKMTIEKEAAGPVIPKPVISIAAVGGESQDGVVTLSLSSATTGGKIMYGFAAGSLTNEYDAANKPTISVGQTIYAQYVSADGNSAVESKTWSGPLALTVTFEDVDGTKLADLTSTDGTTYSGVVNSLKAVTASNNTHYHFVVSDGSSKYYAIISNGTDNNWENAGTYYSGTSGVRAFKTNDSNRYFAVTNTENQPHKVSITLTDDGTDVTKIRIARIQQPRKEMKVTRVVIQEIDNAVGKNVLELAYDATRKAWTSPSTLDWDRDGSGSTPYRVMIVSEYADGTSGVSVTYATWAENNGYWLTNTDNMTTSPYNYNANDANAKYAFQLSKKGSYKVYVGTDCYGKASWISVSTTPLYRAANVKEWSLSDDKILPKGETKYFYMSALQNDNRLSPEWELIKKDGKYVLDNFVVIPDAQFIIRGVTKDNDGKLTVMDWGTANNAKPYYIYPIKQDFKIDELATVDDTTRPTASFTMKKDCTRGFMWNIGATMVKLEFDPTLSTDNLKATIDFSYPSTLDNAPKKGFPWVGLTSSNITAYTEEAGEKYTFSSKIGVDALVNDGSKMQSIGMDEDGVRSAFTNAFIQWTEDGKAYIYDEHVEDLDDNGTRIYYVESTTENTKTTCQPKAMDAMSSTIRPPRAAQQFKQYTSAGVTTPTSDALTFNYLTTTTSEQFTDGSGNTTKAGTEFAVYEIKNVELQGLFKVFTGYGGRTYGNEVNGLTFFANWGLKSVGQNESAYTDELVQSTVSLPLGGGGQIIETSNAGQQESKDANDGDRWKYKYVEDSGNSAPTGNYDGNHDNAAGRYFRLADRQYVESLRFYLALEPDRDATSGIASHNPQDGDPKNTYNNGRNYSWLSVRLAADRPVISLDKMGTSTGQARWYINRDKNTNRPGIKSYTTVLYKIDKSDFGYDDENDSSLGLPTGTYEQVGDPVVHSLNAPYPTFVEPTTADFTSLSDGWYIARIYDVVYDESWSGDITEKDKWNYSLPIYFFSAKGAKIAGEQIVTTADSRKVYHQAIRVEPDLSDLVEQLADASDEFDPATVSAEITITNVGANTTVLLYDKTTGLGGAAMATAASEGNNDVYYTREADGSIVVRYPAGYLNDDRTNTEWFVLSGTKINDVTNLSMVPHVEGGSDVDPVTAKPTTFMPAGKLYGTLVGQANWDDNYNYLAVGPQEEDTSARIYFVDTRKVENDEPEICYIAGIATGTGVKAQVKYDDKELFAADLLDMLGDGADQAGVYTSKSLTITNLPYKAASDTDIDNSSISIRKDQEADFTVELTYSTTDFDPWTSDAVLTEMTYTEDNLTSPRQGLKDLKKSTDKRGGAVPGERNKFYATDVTAVTESYVEKYGGLFTNIEDAHVALQARDRNTELVSFNSFNKWYMDHGDTWEADGAKPEYAGKANPFNPNDHRAVGNTKRNSAEAYATPEEVHPLLRNNTTTVATAGFQEGSVNSAWWNKNQYNAPEFHVADHIKGKFVRNENGAITGWTSTGDVSAPHQHREWWAGVKAGNDSKYNVFGSGDGASSVVEVDGMSVDIRDPKHSYYALESHFTSTVNSDTLRTAFHLGEIPLNANDVLALYGNSSDPKGVAEYLGSFDELRSVVVAFHEKMDQPIMTAKYGTDGKATVTLGSKQHTLYIPTDAPWNFDNLWQKRADLALLSTTETIGVTGVSPAEQIFKAANNHMVFKVKHVNHESWWVPGKYHQIIQLDIKTRPIWKFFDGIEDYATDEAKEKFVMQQIRMNLDDYCPLAYDVRYTYPFLTSDKYIAASGSATAKAASTNAALTGFNRADDVTDIQARDKGRVPFFNATTANADDYVPTVISDVNDDIRGRGFSIVYNRANGTVTVTAEGDRELKDAAVYDISGSSMIHGASADRVNDQTIVLDVRSIAQGAYIVSTNLGGAKFMK